MAASGFTPISLYHSTTAAAAPVNTNLVAGELALNITDGKLYYKDNTNTVKLLASSVLNNYTTTGTGTVLALQTIPVFVASRVTVSALGTLTTGTTTIDLATAQVYTATITAANTITLAFSNAPAAGTSQVVLLRLTNAGGGTIVYPASTKFAAGAAPVFTVSGVDVIGIYYDVTTTTYMVFVIGLDVKVP